MAKVKLGNVSPGATPLIRGAFLIKDTKHGAVAQKWPIKRGKPKTPYDFYKQTEFGIASSMAANPHWLDFGTAVEMVKGTTLVPRDFLVRCAYGYQYQIIGVDGHAWEAFRDVTPNPQYVLDLITTSYGSMLWRDHDGWQAIPLGSGDYVLTWTVTGPQWLSLPNPYVPIDINALLDTITDEPGAILFRGVTDWVGLSPDTVGFVLVQGATGPEWVDLSDLSLLHNNATANLTAGFSATAANKGTVTSGTLTPSPADGNLQRYVNNGAHTLAPPSVGTGDSCQIVLLSTNGASAAAPTVSGWTKVTGDAFVTTNGAKFALYMTVINGTSILNRLAL